MGGIYDARADKIMYISYVAVQKNGISTIKSPNRRNSWQNLYCNQFPWVGCLYVCIILVTALTSSGQSYWHFFQLLSWKSIPTGGCSRHIVLQWGWHKWGYVQYLVFFRWPDSQQVCLCFKTSFILLSFEAALQFKSHAEVCFILPQILPLILALL